MDVGPRSGGKWGFGGGRKVGGIALGFDVGSLFRLGLGLGLLLLLLLLSLASGFVVYISLPSL